jgi:hypothetical protein
MPSPYLPLTVAAAGVASHLFYFHYGEHWMYPVRYMQAFLLACITATVAQTQYGELPLKTSLASTAKYASLYLAGAYSSLIIYRLFFNPLNKIPGPYWARLSRFHLTYNVGAKRNLNHYLLAMHQKYGKFVRIDPNGISCTHADGAEITLGPRAKCGKNEWYVADSPRCSLHSTRSKAIHDQRRRIWSPAFSDRALRGYENRVQRYNELLVSKLDESNGTYLDETRRGVGACCFFSQCRRLILLSFAAN